MAQELWERLPEDTDEEWEAFTSFRDQAPPRRLIRPGKWPTAKLAEWYRTHEWRLRVAAWDAHLDALRRAEIEAVVKQDAKERAALQRMILADGREILMREFAKLLAKSQGSDFEALNPSQLAKLFDMWWKAERAMDGEVSEKVATTIDTSGMSVSELRACQIALEKMRGLGSKK